MFENLNQYDFLFILAILTLVLFFVFFRKKIGQRPEVAFLAVALICGSLLSFSEQKAFVISWDDQIHYKNAAKIASGIIGGRSRPIVVGGSSGSYSLDEQNKINGLIDSQYRKSQAKPENSDSLVYFYNKIAYLPSSFVLIFGSLMRLPYHIIFMLARWINLPVYALIVFFAIRKLKSGKMIMSIVALFPTTIFLASNYNYDSWVTAFTLLGLAYLFSELQQPDKKTTLPETIIMIGAFVIGLGPKAIYFPLMFLLFLLKKEKFDSVKTYKKYILASALSILFVAGSFLLPFLINGPGNGDHRDGNAVNSTQQVKFILSEPLAYTKTLADFMIGYINPLKADGFMTFFAYLGMAKGFFLVLAVLAVVVFTDKNKYDKFTSIWKTRLLIIIIYLVTVALICTALYISFTPVGSATIAGVQPRYLIPLVFPLLFIIGSSRIKNPFNKNIYNAVIFALMALVILQGAWDLIIKHYY